MEPNNLIEEDYFEWLYDMVVDESESKLSYRKLLKRMFHIDFVSMIAIDENRANDGIALRYKFGEKRGLYKHQVEHYIDRRPCSLLEMMIALSIRLETQIMDDPIFGDRTGQWFWNMLVSLGLGSMTDDNYDTHHVEDTICDFLHRNYSPDGKGGLFTIEGCKHDLRNVDIWYQAMWYLDTVLDETYQKGVFDMLISVKERLPEVGEDVLVFVTGGYMAIGRLGVSGIFYDVNDSEGHDITPTHWMLLPEPPNTTR